MKEKIIETLKSWFIEFKEVEETETHIAVRLSKHTILTSVDVVKLREKIGKTFLIECNKGDILLTWYKKS